MNYNQYLNSIKEIETKRKKLDELEKEIKDEARREGLFLFELKELIEEIEQVSLQNINNTDVQISMKVPDYCKDIEAVRNRLNNDHAIMSTFFFACGGISLTTRLDKDTKLSDGTSIWNHISISKGKNPFGQRLLQIDKDAQKKVMFYINPDSDLLKNTTVAVAVENIIKRRESKIDKQNKETTREK